MWNLDFDEINGVITDTSAQFGETPPIKEKNFVDNVASSSVMDDVQVINVDQNSDDWFQARMGIPTASAFNKVVSEGRSDQPSVTRRKYMLQLLGERLTGIPTESFDTPQFKRGHQDEGYAANDYSFRQAVTVKEAGFLRSGDMGYSPDRLIVDQPGAVEIKSKKPDLQLAVLLDNEMPNVHMPQVQGGMLVGGFEYIDFVSYCEDLPLFVKRIYRDESYIDWLYQKIQEFNDELNNLEAHVRNKYYGEDV